MTSAQLNSGAVALLVSLVARAPLTSSKELSPSTDNSGIQPPFLIQRRRGFHAGRIPSRIRKVPSAARKAMGLSARSAGSGMWLTILVPPEIGGGRRCAESIQGNKG